MMAKRSDEQKILFDPYISISTIQRYFGLSKIDATDLFIKTQNSDLEKGYLNIFESKVRSEAVFEMLGLSLEIALQRYELKNRRNI